MGNILMFNRFIYINIYQVGCGVGGCAVISLYVFHEDNPGGHDGQGLKSSG